MGTRKPPPNSSAAPKQAVEVPGVALDNIPGEPVLGTTVPMQEGTAAEPPMAAASALRGAPPQPPSVTGKLADANEFVQLGNAAIAEGTPRTAWTSVPQDKHSTGTSPPSTSKSSAEPRASAVLPSQEITPGLDKATSPPATAASISQDTGSPTKPAAASASPAAGLPGVPPHAAVEGARMAAPPSADPPSAPSAKVTFSSATIGVGEATEPGTRALSDTSHKASQDPPVDPTQQSPALSAWVPSAAVPAAGETLPPSHSMDLGTAGDGLPGANAVTHPQASALAPGTPAMDVTTAKHIPTASIPALGSTSAELVSVRSEPSARDTAGTASTETKATPVGISMRLSPHAAPNGPGGPSQGPFMHSMGSLVPQTSSAGPGATTAEADAGGSKPAGPSVAASFTSLSLTVTSGAKPDGAPPAAAAATSSIAVYGIGTGTAAHSSSLISNTLISEARMGTASLASAAPPATISSTHVPVPNTTSTSPATMPAANVFPRNTIPPATSAGRETFMETGATTGVPSAMAKASSTSSTLSLAVTHDKAGTTTAIAAESTTDITAESTTAMTEWTTTTIAAGTTAAVAAVSNPAIAAGTAMAITADSTTAITADSTTAIAAETTTAIAAESTTAITAGTTTVIAVGTTMTTTERTTTAIAAETTVAVAPTAPVSPAKEAGPLPIPGTMAPGRPQATTSPATAPAPAFGTQKGLTTAPSTSAHTTAGHKNPAPEPQPPHRLIMPAASLYPFGMEQGDQECIQRMVDFNSLLFKPEIGFPFGKSLRDVLYFTDNGQIIFPHTENYVPSNPNPPPRGFSGQEGLPMVAAFWDDADFSQGVGTTWYQEYSTLSSTQDPLVLDVEKKIKKYLKTPYTAKWTLKVTWEKAPAYPSQHDDTHTNTYQAVLTTDGNHSFVLLLYQDGGMQWNYTKLAAGNVLIGFSSGDGYAQNNELTQQPPAVKYRPDQHSSAGTDVRGLWIYRLDNGSRVNYRLRCLVWLDTEPAPDTWNRQLLPCPCSQPQAELDPRYRQSRAGAFGDPHMTTLDGLTYTFNGLGDFVLLLARDAQTSFVLQGRTAQTGTAQATNFVAFAAQYISTTTTTTVEWTLGSQGETQVLLNNESIQFSYSQDMGTEVYYSPGVLLVNTSSITAVFDGAIAISISANSGILSVVCSLPSQYQNSTKGLLGVWDNDPADDFQMPNGTSIPVNSSEEEVYSYGMTWAAGEHSLFAQPLDSPVMNFTPIFLSRLRQENESQYQLAALQCHGSKECIYDSLSTGDVALGLATQTLTDDFQQKKTALTFRTERVTRQYRAMGVGARFVPHLSPELNISESGTLMWEPRGTAPFTINLQAVGSNNLSALLQLRFTLCNCSRSQECDYSNTVTLEGSSLQLAACMCEGGYSDIDECAQGTVCPENATCINTVGSYNCSCPDGEEDLPRRSVLLRVRTLQNATVGEVNGTVSAILGSLEVKAFQRNTNITQTTDSNGLTFLVVSEFTYNSRGTVIQFLNEELLGAITAAFNRQRGRREAGTPLLFQHLHRDNITDLVKLTVAELRRYFPCGLYGYKGYRLHYTGTNGFVCMSPCKMGYCQHGGQCQHLPEGPTCSCLPFSIFFPGGTRCEQLAISLAAFLGILLGALALLCLLLAITCLASHICRRHQQQG
ncbi:mucin-4 [Limosa lapponica baueri]|uniref:Mucin-4 n=1 Tax=Limosa lapponica baueri TaxID=1758121 RepID=A0A2I0U1B7_LIMLA|nr:mucin-4 [Limosa lapponica baueri]